MADIPNPRQRPTSAKCQSKDEIYNLNEQHKIDEQRDIQILMTYEQRMKLNKQRKIDDRLEKSSRLFESSSSEHEINKKIILETAISGAVGSSLPPRCSPCRCCSG